MNTPGLPPLTYEATVVGEVLPVVEVTADATEIARYCEATGFRGPSASRFAPPTIADDAPFRALWTRYQLPRGGLQASQAFSFHQPIPVGDVVRVESVVVRKDERRGKGFVTVESRWLLSGDTLAVVATSTLMVGDV